MFVLLAATPGGIGASLKGDQSGSQVSTTAAAEARAAYLNMRYGLDRPVIVQYLRWLAGVSPLKFGERPMGTDGRTREHWPIIEGVFSLGVPDLGRSMQNDRPVLDVVLERAPVSLGINLAALLLAVGIAVPSGALAGLRRGGWWDVFSSALWLMLWSIPIVWASAMMLHWLAGQSAVVAGWMGGGVGGGLFPVGELSSSDRADYAAFWPGVDASGLWRRGSALDTLWHLCLPVACLAYADIAIVARMTRAATAEGVGADHVRTAVAKGLSPSAVARRHVLRPTLMPLVVLVAGSMGGLIAGSVIVENVFNLPGMGRLVLDAIDEGDRELLLAAVLVLALANLAAMLAADLIYAWLDPRVVLR